MFKLRVTSLAKEIAGKVAFREAGSSAKQDLRSFSETASKGMIVEFVGPSGVGKTTFVRMLQPYLAKTWFLPHQAAALRPTQMNEDELELLYRRIFLKQMEKLQTSENNVLHLTLRAGERAKLVRTELIIRQGSFPRGFVLDEGVFKSFAPIVADLADSDFRILLKNRALILLYPREPGTVVDRYLERWSRRRASGNFPGILRQREEDLERVLTTTREHVVNCDRAERLGAPVLRLAAEDDEANNRAKFREFEHFLLGKAAIRQ